MTNKVSNCVISCFKIQNMISFLKVLKIPFLKILRKNVASWSTYLPRCVKSFLNSPLASCMVIWEYIHSETLLKTSFIRIDGQLITKSGSCINQNFNPLMHNVPKRSDTL